MKWNRHCSGYLLNPGDILDLGHTRRGRDLLKGPLFSDRSLLLWRLLAIFLLVFIQDKCRGVAVCHESRQKQTLNDQNIRILCSIPKTSILANSGKLCWQVINFCVDDNMILLFDKLFFLANLFSISPGSPPLVWDLDPASFWKCFPYPLAAP